MIRVNIVHPTGVNTPMGIGGMQADLGAAMSGHEPKNALLSETNRCHVAFGSQAGKTFQGR